MTKEEWVKLSPRDKENTIKGYLDGLIDIDTNKHKLSGTKKAGTLCKVRKELTDAILEAITWESQ